MEPITREEYYLAKIAGTYEGNTPEPVTIEEYYLATMAGDYSGNTPQPVTRLQYYMAILYLFRHTGCISVCRCMEKREKCYIGVFRRNKCSTNRNNGWR